MAAVKSAGTRDDASEYISLAPFREVWQRRQRHGLTLGDVGRRMGVNRERAAVLLGAKRTTTWTVRNGEVHRRERVQARCTYEVAVALCRALDVNPWEVDV